MNDNHFRVEESAALLLAILPQYPELHEVNASPQIGPFLLTLLAGERANWRKMYSFQRENLS
jgi:hypothetical protein